MTPLAESAGSNYVGGELELFARAANWKRYWSHVLGPCVRGRVLDVGAGLGATARLFARHEGVDSWLALEPDASLAAEMRAIAPEYELKKPSWCVPIRNGRACSN
jgi:hypothetical protein